MPVQTHPEMATGMPGPMEDGSWRLSPSPFFPSGGLSEDGLGHVVSPQTCCRTEQLLSREATSNLVTRLLMFAFPLPISLIFSSASPMSQESLSI